MDDVELSTMYGAISLTPTVHLIVLGFGNANIMKALFAPRESSE